MEELGGEGLAGVLGAPGAAALGGQVLVGVPLVGGGTALERGAGPGAEELDAGRDGGRWGFGGGGGGLVAVEGIRELGEAAMEAGGHPAICGRGGGSGARARRGGPRGLRARWP
ncbi:MAG TPA: hypothetical protein VNF08_00250 [Acidimicrobiales bacterium]|nr:hypothetical protein [Acidimicrobiales bacterium]